MGETLLQFPRPVAAPDGRRYEARACGAPMNDSGLWQGWIEFVPLDGGELLRSSRETTQPKGIGGLIDQFDGLVAGLTRTRDLCSGDRSQAKGQRGKRRDGGGFEYLSLHNGNAFVFALISRRAAVAVSAARIAQGSEAPATRACQSHSP